MKLSRTVIGIICIVLAIAIAVVVLPMANKIDVAKEAVIRVTTPIAAGEAFTAENIAYVEVPTDGIPDGAYRPSAEDISQDQVIGKYASADLATGDFIFESKISATIDDTEHALSNIPDGKVAISFNIDGFSNSVSQKLKKGDIISVVATKQVSEMTDDGKVVTKTVAYVPDELKYVQILTTTTSSGIDQENVSKNEDGTYAFASTITMFAEQRQVNRLVLINGESLYFVLVCRDDEEKAQELLKTQDEIIEKLDAVDDQVAGDETVTLFDSEGNPIAEISGYTDEDSESSVTPVVTDESEDSDESGSGTEVVVWELEDGTIQIAPVDEFKEQYFGYIENGEQKAMLLTEFEALTEDEKAILRAKEGYIVDDSTFTD